MFKTILMTAAAAILVTTAAMPAHALVSLNGVHPNGASYNGREINGAGENGREINGGGTNGYSTQGREINGYATQGTSTGAISFTIDAIELPARAR